MSIRLERQRAKATAHEVISRLDPFYASIDQVRLAGGMLIRKLSDLTLACSIYNTSQKADLLCLHPPIDPNTDNFKRLVGARNNWVALSVARELMMNVNQIIGQKGSHVLANFSVTREGGGDGEGLAARLADLTEDIKEYEVTLRSWGKTWSLRAAGQ